MSQSNLIQPSACFEYRICAKIRGRSQRFRRMPKAQEGALVMILLQHSPRSKMRRLRQERRPCSYTLDTSVSATSLSELHPAHARQRWYCAPEKLLMNLRSLVSSLINTVCYHKENHIWGYKMTHNLPLSMSDCFSMKHN